MAYRGVVFDLDGTLLDTLDDLAESMNAVLSSLGHSTHHVDAYRHFIGDGARKLAERALGKDGSSEEVVDRCIAAMRQEYGKRWARKTRPYEGIDALLEALEGRGVKAAVLSNKPDDFTKAMVDKFFSRHRFAAVAGAKDSVPRKPDPAGALAICQETRLVPGECLYVGDTNTDMKTACAAGMYAVGALWGFREADELLASGANVLVQHPREILKLL